MIDSIFISLFYAFGLFLLVFLAPALALLPRLISTPRYWVITPIISLFLCNTIGFMLIHFHWYTHLVVLTISLCFLMIALLRCYCYLKSFRVYWPPSSWQALLLSLAFTLPVIFFSATTVFSDNDALASWNYWALHFYNQQLVTHTLYPQFFSLIISYCYKLLGTYSYQSSVKLALCSLLVFIPLSLIGLSFKSLKKHLIAYIVLIGISIFPGLTLFNHYKFYSLGYADPLMAASLVAAVALLINHYKQDRHPFNLSLVVICAIVAAWSKQPALLFVIISLPLITLVQWIKNDLKLYELVSALIIMAAGLLWVCGPGSGFYHNTGVIHSSLHNSATISSTLNGFLNGCYQYLVRRPLVLVLLLLSLFAAFKNTYTKYLYLFFIIPSTVLWFTFANYSIREGLHITFLAGLIIASNGLPHFITHFIPQWFLTLEAFLSKHNKKVIILLLLLGLSAGILFAYKSLKRRDFLFFPLNANKTIAYKYFPSIGERVYTIMKNNKLVILTPTHYSAGMFYATNTIVSVLPQNQKNLVKVIKQQSINYLVVSKDITKHLFKITKELAEQPDSLITLVPMKAHHDGFYLFKMDPG